MTDIMAGDERNHAPAATAAHDDDAHAHASDAAVPASPTTATTTVMLEYAAPLQPVMPPDEPRLPAPPAASASEAGTRATPQSQQQHPNVLSAASALFEQLDPEVSSQVREVGWSILERFARVTRASRDTATRILDHPLSRPILPVLPRDVQGLATTYRPEEHTGTVVEEVVRELPMASLYLARWVSHRVMGAADAQTGRPVVADEDVWEDSDEETELGEFGLVSTGSSLPKPASKRSPAKRLTAELWVQYYTSNFRQSIPLDGSEPSTVPSGEDSDGGEPNVTDVILEIKERIFLGGIDPDVRPQVWKFLLGFLPWGSTMDEQEAIVRAKSKHYAELKAKWQTYSEATMNPAQWEIWLDWRHRIVKDVIRTDRHHAFYASYLEADGDTPKATNLDEEEFLMATGALDEAAAAAQFVNPSLVKLTNVLASYVQYLDEIGRGELGYVQGMSDLCSVLLMLHAGDEVDTFWCFVGLMERLHPNFHMDQQAMHAQLTTLRALVQFVDFPLFRHLAKCDALNMFFAFRWLLIWFKREYSTPDVMRVWEVCLADVRSAEYPVFVALAMLEHARADVLAQCSAFDEVLKLVNNLAENLLVDSVLDTADELFQVFDNKMATIVRSAQASPAAGAGAAAAGSASPAAGGRTSPNAARVRVSSLDAELAKTLRRLTLSEL
ncbi:GTPase activating protein [Blastocladiella emersonii ATCC 22665]|nr:GTPase activating protein [Blastocladiella emersonii ATCC 22665]